MPKTAAERMAASMSPRIAARRDTARTGHARPRPGDCRTPPRSPRPLHRCHQQDRIWFVLTTLTICSYLGIMKLRPDVAAVFRDYPRIYFACHRRHVRDDASGKHGQLAAGQHPRSPRQRNAHDAQRSRRPHGRHAGHDVDRRRPARAARLRHARARPGRSTQGATPSHRRRRRGSAPRTRCSSRRSSATCSTNSRRPIAALRCADSRCSAARPSRRNRRAVARRSEAGEPRHEDGASRPPCPRPRFVP